MKIIKEKIITKVEFRNGTTLRIGDFTLDGIITGFDKVDDYVLEVYMADGREGWSVYLDQNANEVDN